VNGEAWAAVEAHFDALRELTGGQRAAGLAAIPDEEIRREVASLLEHSSDGGTVAAAVSSAVSGLDSAFAGEHLGPYRLVRRLGQGGQGAVFEAVRDDGRFEQRVAIKIVKWEMDSEPARRRFRDERQMLAGLQHPYIARLLDGGETPNGTPYLVMEFIDGRELIQATEGWSPRRKLELFVKVAEAVGAAHRNLIVHRDLKPANILITKEGNPKLLDFGIAKLLDAGADRTQTLLRALTPDYASPEQVHGLPISTASDVYSLGVVLYQMLTGRKPYRLETLTPMEMDRVISQQPPEPAGLGSELDAILAMALRKEPERRYSGMGPFADDIERYLAELPVRARPDTIRYRSVKFVRRHSLALAAGAAVMVSLVGGLTIAVRQARIALEQSRIANQHFAEVRQLANRILFEVPDRLARLPGAIETRRMLADTATEYLGRLSKSTDDPQLLWETAQGYYQLSGLLGWSASASLGRMGDGITAARKAISIKESLLARGVLSPPQIEQLLQEYLELGDSLRIAWREREGANVVAAGIEVARRYVPKRLAAAEILLARLDARIGRITEAERLIEDAAGQIAGPGLNALEDPVIAPTAAEVALRAGDFDRSIGLWRVAVANGERILVENPADRGNATGIVFDLFHLGGALGPGDWPNLGQASEAEPVLERGLNLASRALAQDPENQPPRAGVVATLLMQAQVIQGRHPGQALVIYRRALAEAQKSSTEFAAYPELGSLYLYTIITPLAQSGNYSEARGFFDRARTFLEARLKNDPADLYAAYHLAGAWMQWADAQTVAAEALPASQNAERVIGTGIAAAPADYLLSWRLSQILEHRHRWLIEDERKTNAARLLALRQKWLEKYPRSEFHRHEVERAFLK
jgi:predicted Ser/Thr protein kinase